MSEKTPLSIRQFEAACRQAGLKVTHQRLEIYRELASATDHPSAETLHSRLISKMPTLSLDTVYRTLSIFCEKGLVHKVETVESHARYEAVHVRHHHLICSRCRKITDFQWPSMDEALLPDEFSGWGKIDSRSVVVYGICAKCLQQMKKKSETSPGTRDPSGSG